MTSSQIEKQLVVFDLGSESYGVDINAVREIIRMQEITRVPGTADFVEGVINLRGRVIPIVDLRKQFGMPETPPNDENRIVVVDIQEQDLGVIVDAVTEVLRISADTVEPPSSLITTADSEYLIGIAKLESKLVILLDLDRVLSETEKSTLLEVAGAAS